MASAGTASDELRAPAPLPRPIPRRRKAKALSSVPTTIFFVSCGYALTKIMPLWQSRTWATFTVTVTPSIKTISWCQSSF